MRFVAGGDYDTGCRVFTRWPLEELLEGALRKARHEALIDWRFRWVLWSLIAPHQKTPDDRPAKPKILEIESDAP